MHNHVHQANDSKVTKIIEQEDNTEEDDSEVEYYSGSESDDDNTVYSESSSESDSETDMQSVDKVVTATKSQYGRVQGNWRTRFK